MKSPKPATIAELIEIQNAFNTFYDLHQRHGPKFAPATLPLLEAMRDNALAASIALKPLLGVRLEKILDAAAKSQ